MDNAINNDINNSTSLSLKYGTMAGVGMAIILFIFQIAETPIRPVINMSTYLIPVGVLVIAFTHYKKELDSGIFISGLKFGSMISVITAFSVVLINWFLYLLAADYTFTKFGISPENAIQFSFVAAAWFIETFVFGMLITFIILQYLKGNPGTSQQ